MRTIIFASNNAHKLEEVRRIFKLYKILSLNDIGFTDDIVEDGFSFQENSFIKANAVVEFMKKNMDKQYAVLADDSGLCVKAINYEPGIMSARYSGGGSAENRKKLLSKLTTIQDRTAYFQCYATLIMPSGETYTADGKVYGLISKTEIGDKSFGYDCIFWSEKLRKTFGQATPEEKDSISHRAMAMKKIKEYIDNTDYMSLED